MIAHRQHFIHQQRFRLQVRGHGECQAHLHSGAVMLQRRIDKISDFGKGHDLIEFAVDFPAAHAQNRAVQIGVLAAGQFRVKAGAHFQEAADAAMNFRAANRGLRDAGKNFQQGGFSRAVAADQAHDFALAQFERNVAQGPEIRHGRSKLRCPFEPSQRDGAFIAWVSRSPMSRLAGQRRRCGSASPTLPRKWRYRLNCMAQTTSAIVSLHGVVIDQSAQQPRATTASDDAASRMLGGWPCPVRAQRNPSMTPAMGFNP